MKIKINDAYQDYEIKKPEVLFDIIRALQSDFQEKHQVVTEILLNGDIISPEEEKLKEVKISRGDKIEINTTHLRDITIQNAIESLRVLPKIREDFKNISLYLKTGEEQKITIPLLDCLKGIRWFNVTLSSLEKVLGVDLSEIKSGEISLLDAAYRLVDVLKILLASLEGQDKIRTSDVIDYELSPLLDEFIKIVPELIKELDKRIIH